MTRGGKWVERPVWHAQPGMCRARAKQVSGWGRARSGITRVVGMERPGRAEPCLASTRLFIFFKT